jgi:threonine dehydrogenase-like Zn-dependent dehydrogenase
MKAAVLYGDGDIRYEDFPKPHPKRGEVLVKVAYSGLCGSDIPRLIHSGAHFYPIVLGHEFSGTIESVGEGVEGTRVGETISCAPLIPDMNDIQSARGNYSLSKKYSFIGSREPGGFAEYVCMPSVNAFPLPKGVSLEEGAFFEPLTVTLHALNLLNFPGGTVTAITGMGTIGLLALQAAKALGAGKTVVFDIDEERLTAARELGADLALNTLEEGFKEKALEFVKGEGYEICIETGGVPITEKLCLQLAARKGRVMFVGTPHVPLTLEPDEFEWINRKELIVTGSWMNYSAPFPGWEWTTAVELFKAGKIKTEVLIDRKVPLSKAKQAVDDLQIPGKVKGKILFVCSDNL